MRCTFVQGAQHGPPMPGLVEGGAIGILAEPQKHMLNRCRQILGSVVRQCSTSRGGHCMPTLIEQTRLLTHSKVLPISRANPFSALKCIMQASEIMTWCG